MSALSKAATCRRTQKLTRRAQQNLRAPAVSPDIISCSSVFRALWWNAVCRFAGFKTFVSAGVIAFVVESRRKKCRDNEREELFLARVVKDGRSGFALVEIGPALRHVIFVI